MGIAIDLKRRAPPPSSLKLYYLKGTGTYFIILKARLRAASVFPYNFLTCLLPQIPAERSVDEIFADVCAALDKL